MNTFLKKNKNYLILTMLLFLILTILILQREGILNRIGVYLFHHEEWEQAERLTDNPFYGSGLFSYIQFVFTSQYLEFDYLLIFGTAIYQIIMPLVVMVAIWLFYKEKSTILNFQIYREKNIKRLYFKKILIHSFKISCAAFIASILYYGFCYLLTNGRLYSNNEVIREFLIDILGNDFYLHHIYFYYFIDCFIKFFAVTFSYAFFAQTLLLVISNIKIAMFAMPLYYYGISSICFILYSIGWKWSLYMNPSTIMASGDYPNVNSLLLILNFMFPFMLSCVLIIINKYEEL